MERSIDCSFIQRKERLEDLSNNADSEYLLHHRRANQVPLHEGTCQALCFECEKYQDWSNIWLARLDCEEHRRWLKNHLLVSNNCFYRNMCPETGRPYVKWVRSAGGRQSQDLFYYAHEVVHLCWDCVTALSTAYKRWKKDLEISSWDWSGVIADEEIEKQSNQIDFE